MVDFFWDPTLSTGGRPHVDPVVYSLLFQDVKPLTPSPATEHRLESRRPKTSPSQASSVGVLGTGAG